MTSIEELAQRHAEHEAAAAELAAQLEQQRGEAEAVRQERLNEYDREVIASYDATEEHLIAEEKHLYEAFRAAVLADPLIAAWVAFRSVRERRDHLRTEVTTALTRLGSNARPPVPLTYYPPRIIEDILSFAETEARNIAGDWRDQRAEAREAAGEGETP